MPLDGDIKNFVKTDSEVVTVLKKARALIDVPGNWSQCGGGWSRGQYCVGRAIFVSMGIHSWPDDTSKIPAYETFCAANPEVGVAVAFWNDNLNRTLPEVLAAFDRAIALAESKQ